MSAKNQSNSILEGIPYIISIIGFPLLIGSVISLIQNIIGIKSIERVVEHIPYTTKTIYTDQLASDVTCEKPSGKEGVVVKEYKIIKHFGKESSRELISEKTNVEVVNEIKIVGTAHRFSGYCSVEGTYRRRYAQCYGDYSPQSLQKAQAQAYICNTSAYNESGCYDTYYSSIYNGTKSCTEIKVEDL